MSKDGININSAPSNFTRPLKPPGRPAHVWGVFGKLVVGCHANKYNFKPDTWLQNSDLTDIRKAASIWNKRA